MKTAKKPMVHCKKHYDLLIDENNDTALDSEALKNYMNKWDGSLFIKELELNKNLSVLEIGVGTGRLAVQVCGQVKEFIGIELSPQTAARAKMHMQSFKNASVICGDFLKYRFTQKFDLIYSSLTFFHIKDKAKAFRKIDDLLTIGKKLVLSLSKSQSTILDYGTRRLKMYPDDLEKTKLLLKESNLKVYKTISIENAYIITAKKQQ